MPRAQGAPQSPIIVIPARMAATRLPQKPLADIGGVPMIVHVLNRARTAGLGPVAVACDDTRIAQAVRAAGGSAVLTRADHASGSDRIAEALASLDPQGEHDLVINLQGDLPLIDPAAIVACADLLGDGVTDIGTLVAPITDPSERENPHVVKAVLDLPKADAGTGTALYFTRAAAPSGEGPLWHHIGIYAYRRAALERFVSAPPSLLERRERLEQLRAYALGLRITAAIIDAAPLGVDTAADLDAARAVYAQSQGQ